MDLSTTWLGFDLPHPLVSGAGPLADDLDTVRRLEDAGAAAIVLRSLFEEQILEHQLATFSHLEGFSEAHPEAASYLPEPDRFALGPEAYVDHLEAVKRAVAIPVVASLNGVRPGGWLDFARLFEEAGADALELNVYQLATDPAETGQEIEDRIVGLVRTLKEKLRIPVAVKLSPFYTSLANVGHRLAEAGADGLVLLNRFYQADLDIEALEAVRTLELSTSSDLLLRLRWLAILSGRLEIPLAATGGVHTATDAVKAVMCGAHAVQLVSCLLRHGPEHLTALRDGLGRWLEEHEYESLAQMRGSMDLSRSPDPTAYERANYMEILAGWRPPS